MKELVGRNLRRLRKRQGCAFTQAELANATGLHRTEIGLLERGQRMPRGETLFKLASVLEISPERLFEGSRWNAAAGQFESAARPWRREEALLQEIGRRLSAAEPGATVILFGSRARGNARPDSDFDLLVIKPTDVPNRRAETGDLRRKLRGLDIAIDLILTSARDAEEWRETEGSTIHAAIHEGRVLVPGD